MPYLISSCKGIRRSVGCCCAVRANFGYNRVAELWCKYYLCHVNQAVMQKLAKSMDPKMLQSIGGPQNMLKMMKQMANGGDGMAEMMQVRPFFTPLKATNHHLLILFILIICLH